MTRSGPSAIRNIAGYFINLDRAVARRDWMERQLQALGAAHRYERYAAIDGQTLTPSRTTPRTAGEVGIFRSHMSILRTAASSGKAVHILEDDAALCDLTIPTLDLALYRGVFEQHDIVFTEMYFIDKVATLGAFMSLYDEITRNRHGGIEKPAEVRVVDVSESYLFGTTSYIVGPRRINRVLTVLEREWKNGPTLAIDVLFQKAARAGQLNIACFFPFLTSIDFELGGDSSAGRKQSADRALVKRLLRYSFFARRDIPGVALPLIREALARQNAPDESAALELHANIFRYLLADRPAATLPDTPKPSAAPKAPRP
jgi:GR25 family glycosyltransferase involved in LPS biosynthesis